MDLSYKNPSFWYPHNMLDKRSMIDWADINFVVVLMDLYEFDGIGIQPHFLMRIPFVS